MSIKVFKARINLIDKSSNHSFNDVRLGFWFVSVDNFSPTRGVGAKLSVQRPGAFVQALQDTLQESSPYKYTWSIYNFFKDKGYD